MEKKTIHEKPSHMVWTTKWALFISPLPSTFPLTTPSIWFLIPFSLLQSLLFFLSVFITLLKVVGRGAVSLHFHFFYLCIFLYYYFLPITSLTQAALFRTPVKRGRPLTHLSDGFSRPTDRVVGLYPLCNPRLYGRLFLKRRVNHYFYCWPIENDSLQCFFLPFYFSDICIYSQFFDFVILFVEGFWIFIPKGPLHRPIFYRNILLLTCMYICVCAYLCVQSWDTIS